MPLGSGGVRCTSISVWAKVLLQAHGVMRLVGDAADPSESILDARRIQYHVDQAGDWGWRPQVLEEPLVRGGPGVPAPWFHRCAACCEVPANTVFVHALSTPGEPTVRELDLVILLFLHCNCFT